MFWLFQSLLLVFCESSGNAAVSRCTSPPRMVNGILGKSVTFLLNFPADKKANVISWNYNGINVAYIHLNELGETQHLVPFKNWKERLNFTQTYSLHLSNLTMTDAGFYEAQINTEPSLTVSCYTLRIFRPLSNLQVTHHAQLSGNSTCEIHLTCSLENPNDTVSFGWKLSENSSLREPNLTISWDPMSSSEQNYTCIAENPVSNLSSLVTAQSLCTGVKKNVNWVRTLIMILVALFLLAIACALASRAWKNRTGSLPLRTQQTQHPEPLQNTECTSVSPGSTVYAQVTYPNLEMKIPAPTKQDSITIYSTINHSKETKTTSSRATALNNIQ
ncbi:SLAM family member 6 isoform X2 [Marmota marmota marmota]|uniref:SLAM family member 6 isoform X2 n=1 Tax=Marmota marmota marmota TaxID=9994 RepID=UPI0020936FDD|nr:SLAM family member 6 isoform X2 [Marmota marmota marmota]